MASAIRRNFGLNSFMKKFLLQTVTVFIFLNASSFTFAQTAPRALQLKAAAPQFWDLIDRDARLTTIAGGFGFTEGPM